MISISKENISSFDRALEREWLVTNGIGGYASSTVVGANTRRYHGLLIASLPPPAERHLFLAKVDEEITVGPDILRLGTNEYRGGAVYPEGFTLQESFRLELGVPAFEYAASGVRLTKQVWMERGENTVHIIYRLLEAPSQVTISIRPFCSFRSYHSDGQHGTEQLYSIRDDAQNRTVGISALGKRWELKMRLADGCFELGEDWYWNYLYRAECERGFNGEEDLYTPGHFSAALSAGEAIGFTATIEGKLSDEGIDELFEREMARRRTLVKGERRTFRSDLLIAADQFIVKKSNGNASIYAGYHWFTDWGRDTMISLPGLLLSTGRFDEASSVLVEYGERVDGGMIPNRITDTGTLEYNTVDATLWYFEALRRYVESTGDWEIVERLMPRLEEIIRCHLTGTRYGIKVDETDGLLRAGVEGSQLTWMDARVDGVPVTPRIGKPSEINSLWYNALSLIASWAERFGMSADEYRVASERCAANFTRKFWNEECGCLYDVVDGPAGNDTSIRPNQIVAVSLKHTPLEPRFWKPVVDTVERHLLTPYGLRTLSPADPAYRGVYGGSPAQRDSAYHQGTVWPWMLGPFVDAHLRVCGDIDRIKELLRPFQRHLRESGLGSIGEVFSGDPPHATGGCIAQAWSVAEILRISGVHPGMWSDDC